MKRNKVENSKQFQTMALWTGIETDGCSYDQPVDEKNFILYGNIYIGPLKAYVGKAVIKLVIHWD